MSKVSVEIETRVTEFNVSSVPRAISLDDYQIPTDGSNEELRAELRKADRVRGIFPRLVEGDIIQIPKSSSLALYAKVWGGTSSTLTTQVYLERTHRWIELPVSMFCKLSTEEEQNEVLYVPGALSDALLPAMLDSARLKIISGRILRVNSIADLKSAKFQQNLSTGKHIKLEFSETNCVSVKAYVWEEVTEFTIKK